MKVDFHVHSRYSPDSSAKISDILHYAKLRGLDAIAITDHDTLEGNRLARRTRKPTDVQIMPGIELTVPIGRIGLHLIVLGIDEYVACDTVIGTIDRLKRFGATIILPHPYRRDSGLFYHLENKNLTQEEFSYVLENIDYLEALNMKDGIECIQSTLEFAAKHKYPIVSGSDMHSAEYIGAIYTEIDSIDSLIQKHSSNKIVTLVKDQKDLNLHNLHDFLEFSGGTYHKTVETRDSMSVSQKLYNKMRNTRFGDFAREILPLRLVVRFLRLINSRIRLRSRNRRRLLHIGEVIKYSSQAVISFDKDALGVHLRSRKR